MSEQIREWLDESQQLADEAYPGPWGHWPEAGTIEITADNHSKVICNAVRPQGGWGTPIYQSGAEPTAEFIAEARTRFPQAVAALRSVMELHRRASDIHEPDDFCAECSSFHRTVEWPCPTLLAITDALGLEGDDDE